MKIKARYWTALTSDERARMIKWAAEGNQLKYWIK